MVLKKRWADHLSEAINNVKKNQCTYLNNAIRKYGKDDWEITLVFETPDESKINDYETFYIKEYNTLAPNGYNLTGGGDGGTNISEIQKERISKTVTKFWEKKGSREMYSNAQLGKNDLAKIEKVSKYFDKIHECRIVQSNVTGLLFIHFYDSDKKSVNMPNSNKIQYGGTHTLIENDIRRAIHLLNQFQKPISITILDEDLKKQFNLIKQDTSIAGTSLEL